MNAILQKNVWDSALSQVTHRDYFDDDDDDENSDDMIQISETVNDDFVNLNTLYQAFSIVKNKWANSDNQDSQKVLFLF